MYPAACYEVTGNLADCREIKKDGVGFLRLTFDNPTIRETTCQGESREPLEGELERRRSYLESRKYFYVAGWHKKTCPELKKDGFLATVEETCCDTVPVGGACALDGPLVLPPAH